MLPEEKNKEMKEAILQVYVEAWRFSRIYERVLTKLDAQEQKRYVSQFRWFLKKINEALSSAGYRVVDLEGLPYDSGMAATPINLEEFEPNVPLFVEQVLEPTVMDDNNNIVKTGTVILAKVM